MKERERGGVGRGRNPASKCGMRVVTLGPQRPLTIVLMIKGRRSLRLSLWLNKTELLLELDHMGIFLVYIYTLLQSHPPSILCLAFFAPPCYVFLSFVCDY